MSIELGHSRIFKRDDGIIQINCTEHIYTLEDLKEVVDSHKLICEGAKTLVLVIVHPFSDIDTDAKQFMSLPESTVSSVAEAYVLRSLAQKLIANFFVKSNQPTVPTRFFTNREEAILWLKTFKENT